MKSISITIMSDEPSILGLSDDLREEGWVKIRLYLDDFINRLSEEFDNIQITTTGKTGVAFNIPFLNTRNKFNHRLLLPFGVYGEDFMGTNKEVLKLLKRTANKVIYTDTIPLYDISLSRQGEKHSNKYMLNNQHAISVSDYVMFFLGDDTELGKDVKWALAQKEDDSKILIV